MRNFILFSVVFILFGFQSSRLLTTTPVDLHFALSQKMISVNSTSNGEYSDGSVQMNIKNLTAKPIRLKIPALTTYSPNNDGEQTLLQVEDMLVNLSPKTSSDVLVAAFCSELDDRCPTKENSFSIGKSENEKFFKLTNYLRKNKVSKNNYQDAVWAISNNQSINNISIDKPQDKNFRKFMSGLTGQKESWYSSPQETTVDEYGNFNRETVSVSGALVFDSDGVSKTYQSVYNSEGERLLKGKERQLPKAKGVEMSFSLRVKGWKKGTYEVRVMKGSTVLKKFPFEV